MRATKTVAVPTFNCEIYIGGNFADIERSCAAHGMTVGLCVSIEPVKFVYTGGREDGAVVRFINYPRFPCAPEVMREKARVLAEKLMTDCAQLSASIVDSQLTTWLTRRPEDQ